MARALLIIDIQNDYFPGGAYPLVEPEAAAGAAQRVLERFREDGEPVVHLRHVWDAPDATFMRPGTDGIEIHPLVAPADGEAVIDKSEPNGFLGTGAGRASARRRGRRARRRGDDEQHVRGRDGPRGRRRRVRGHGRARRVRRARPRVRGPGVPGDAVHAAFMAALADGYASVVSADSVVSG